jgi:hypothetical protein
VKLYCRGREVREKSDAITRNPILAQGERKLYELFPTFGKNPRFFDTRDYPLILVLEKCTETALGVKYQVIKILKS